MSYFLVLPFLELLLGFFNFDHSPTTTPESVATPTEKVYEWVDNPLPTATVEAPLLSTDLLISTNCNNPLLVDFIGFAGDGFQPTADDGKLCSNQWAVSGFTDGDSDFGDTNTTGDFARGITNGNGVTTGGIYALDSINNQAFWIQPTDTDFTPGDVTLKVRNGSGSVMKDIEISYDVLILDDESRANSFNFSYSTDNSNYTTVRSLDVTSPNGASNRLSIVSKTLVLVGINLPNNGSLYLRWTGDDVSGGGSRDEFGLDNISVCSDVIFNTPLCRAADSLALVDLYNATGGQNWTVTWNLNQPISTWFGVVLNQEGCVEKIQLPNNNLTNTLPSTLDNLENLVEIDLSDNQLTGSIPTAIENLVHLNRFLLSNNQLSGAILPGLGYLPNLTRLDLSQNSFTGNIPSALGDSDQLDSLQLDNNTLNGSIPAEIGNAITLSYLLLNDNNLSGSLPPELGQLNQLQKLVLSNNDLGDCYPSTYSIFCDPAVTTNFNGNPNLPSFSNFCNTGSGACLVNDECVDAIELPINADPCGRNSIEVVLDNSTTSGSGPFSACNTSFSSKDVWFKVTVPSTGSFFIRKDSSTNLRVFTEAYLGCPSSANDVLACANLNKRPFVLTLDNLTPGAEVYFRVWDSLNVALNQTGIGKTELSAHELSPDKSEWVLCDFTTSSNGERLGSGTRKANEFILQYDEDDTADSIAVKRNILIQEFGAVLLDSCKCGTKQLEVWGENDPIELEFTRMGAQSRGRADTTGYNYIISLPTSLDTLVEFQANTFTTNAQDLPAMSMDEIGNFTLVWSSVGQDGSNRGVYGQRYDFLGNKLGSEFQANTTTTNDQNRPDIAMAADGRFTAVWESRDQDGDRDGVYAQRFSKNGFKLGGEFQVNTVTARNQNRPAIAMSDNGRFVIVWRSSQQDDPSGFGVFGQLYDANGATVGGEFQVNTTVQFSQENPDVAMDSDGDFVVVWQSLAQDGDGYGIYGQRFNEDGTTRGSEFQISTETMDNQIRPAVAMDEVGNFVVTWESEGQDGSLAGIYAQRYNRNGLPLGGEFRVNTFTLNDQSLPKVGMDEEGRFIIAWKSGGQDGQGTGIYGQRYDIDGTPVGIEFLINTETLEDQDRPDIAMDADRDFVVSWASAGQDGGGKGVFAQQYFNTFYRVPIQTSASSTEGTGPAQAYGENIYTPVSTIGNVLIGTMDSGIDPTHPRFENALWEASAEETCQNNQVGDIGTDFINNDGDPDDQDEHGTAVNGVLVDEFPNNIQLDIMNVKFYEDESSTLFDAICGIYYAVEQGADVINLSWGFESEEFPSLLKEALDFAVCNDVVLVTSAGNTAQDNSTISKYPSNLVDQIPSLITVGSYEVDFFGENPTLAGYSNFGDKVDLAAIGFLETTTSDSTFSVLAGTSLSAPVVSRVAAQIRAYYPSLSATQIKECIVSTVDNVGLNVSSGGILNESAALACAASAVSSPCASDLMVNANILEETCAGNDGSIDLIVGETAQNLSFAWSNGAMSEDLVNLSAGIYTVSVTDDCGCEQVLELEVQDECSGGNCTANRTINDEPIIGRIYRASNAIESAGVVEAGINVEFRAGQVITLRDGFRVEKNANFTARIQGCALLNDNTVLEERSEKIPAEQAIELQVFPNPTTANATLRYFLTDSTPIQLGVYDLNGRLVHPIGQQTNGAGWHEMQLTIAHLPAGIYFVRLQSAEQQLYQKVIIGE